MSLGICVDIENKMLHQVIKLSRIGQHTLSGGGVRNGDEPFDAIVGNILKT